MTNADNNQIAVRPVQKTAVMIRREMVKIPAVMDALGPVERAVFLASTDKTIAEYDAARRWPLHFGGWSNRE